MSEKHYKWKDIGQPNRLNAFLTPKKELPSKFAPSRDRSQSVDKLFNNSRSRLHSSVEMQALNQTREESFRWRGQQREESKKKEEEKKEETEEKKASLSKFPTLSLVMQQSSITAENRHSALIVTELKKQFWAFKQNVLRELERQKELVLKLVKEIVLTMEVQLEKLGKRQGEERAELKSISTTDNPQSKSLEDWKTSLANIKLATPVASATATIPKPTEPLQAPLKAATSPGRFTETAKDGPLQTPSLPLDITTFLNSLSKLRTQFNEMDKLLEVEAKRGVKS